MNTSRPLRMGVVGLGRAFTLMLPTFLYDKRINIVAGMDTRESARTAFEADFNAPSFSSVEALCEHPEVELIYIASPHQFHACHIEIAAAAGHHILVEKPLALSLDECERIITAVERAKVVLVVGHSHSFNTPVLAARQLIQKEQLGRVRMIHAYNYTDFIYRPRRPEELDTSQGGGVIFSQAAHQVDVVRFLADSPVHSLRAHTGNWDAARSTEGAYMALLSFENGAFASLTYSGYGHYDSDARMKHISELGTQKEAEKYYFSQRRAALQAATMNESGLKADSNYGGPSFNINKLPIARYHQHFGEVIVSTAKADIRLQPDGLEVYSDTEKRFISLPLNNVPRVEVIDELYQAIRLNKDNIHNAYWGRATMEVCFGLLESAQHSREVTMKFQK